MTRAEIRRRALRAAMAVTLGTGMLGCGITVTGPASSGDGGSATANGGGAASVVDPTPSITTTENGGGGAGGTAVTTTDASGGAGPTQCGPLMQDWKAYQKCCDAVNWDFHKGCEAWGPPMPPAMDWIAKEVA